MTLTKRVGKANESVYTLKDLRCLILGGRISHMKGLILSLLNLKPLIGVEKVNGTYEQLEQERTYKQVIKGLVNRKADHHAPESALRVNVFHA